jgi:hypothetical protein
MKVLEPVKTALNIVGMTSVLHEKTGIVFCKQSDRRLNMFSFSRHGEYTSIGGEIPGEMIWNEW